MVAGKPPIKEVDMARSICWDTAVVSLGKTTSASSKGAETAPSAIEDKVGRFSMGKEAAEGLVVGGVTATGLFSGGAVGVREGAGLCVGEASADS